MLKTFYVDNFKTHINTTYNLAPVNLLVGDNNSGKTNLCQAIRFLGLTSSLPLSSAANVAANESWTLANVYFDKATIDFRVEAELTYEQEPVSFQYELSLRLLDPGEVRENGSRITLDRECLSARSDSFANAELIRNNRGQVQLLHETKSRGKQPQYVETHAPTDATMLSRLYDLRGNPRANLFKKHLASWYYYDLDSQQLRRPEARLLDTVLHPDGSNLASVLFNLKNADERLYRKLIEVTQRIEPRLDVLSFFSPAENQVFMFGEDSTGHRFGPWSMSNGTLRFLALAYVLLTTQAYQNQVGGRLVIIEEPETGLFVGHLKELLSLIDSPGSGQFIFTSHSPYFIDLFDGMLEGVKVARRGDRSSSLASLDTGSVRKQLKQMPLGEMHFRELLAR
jgi:predicted ATPase